MKSSIFLAIPATFLVSIAVSTLQVNSEETQGSSDDNLFCEDDVANVTLCTKITNQEIKDPCSNIFDDAECELWAQMNECDKNPNFMHYHCARSCEECNPIIGLGSKKKSKKEETGEAKNANDVIQESSYGQTKDEKKHTKEYSKRVNAYKKALFQDPTTTSKTRQLCINELSKCTYYASLGLCEQRVIFMLETCPLACMMCEQKEQFDQCVGMRHPFDLPTFVSDKEYQIIQEEALALKDDEVRSQVKTVDTFFQSKKDDSKWIGDYSAEYVNDPTKHKNGDSSWIVKMDNILSLEECQSVIDLGNKVGWMDSSEINDVSSFLQENANNDDIDTKPKYTFKSAKCSSSSSDSIKCDDDATLSIIQRRISDLTQIPLEYFEPSEIIHFPESDGYQSLQHYSDIHDIWKIVGTRVLSFYIPLTSVEKGGYVGFPSLDWLMIQPKVGQMILWSNVMSFDPSVINAKMANEVLPVQEGGDLYVLRIHVRQFDYDTAKTRGLEHCT